MCVGPCCMHVFARHSPKGDGNDGRRRLNTVYTHQYDGKVASGQQSTYALVGGSCFVAWRASWIVPTVQYHGRTLFCTAL